MRKKIALLLIVFIVALTSKVYAIPAETWSTVEVSGYTGDTVLDSLEERDSTNTVDKSYDVWVAESFPDATDEDKESGGLFPAGKTITTTSRRKYKLADSNEPNTLQIWSTDGHTQGSLTLTTEKKYEKLSFLVTSGDGESVLSAKAIYSDETESDPIEFRIYDWCEDTDEHTVYSGLYKLSKYIDDRIQRDVDAKLFEATLELDKTKTVERVDFEFVSGNGKANVFAVSGVVTKEFTVKFIDGDTELSSKSIIEGEKAEKPEAPTKDGYTFVGWYSDEELTDEYDFDTLITKDTNIYAKWEAVATDEEPEEEEGSKSKSPKTGDNIALWICLTVVSIACIYRIIKRR